MRWIVLPARPATPRIPLGIFADRLPVSPIPPEFQVGLPRNPEYPRPFAGLLYSPNETPNPSELTRAEFAPDSPRGGPRASAAATRGQRGAETSYCNATVLPQLPEAIRTDRPRARTVAHPIHLKSLPNIRCFNAFRLFWIMEGPGEERRFYRFGQENDRGVMFWYVTCWIDLKRELARLG